MSGQVWGGIEAALLCLSIITDVALLAVALQLLLAPSRKLLAEVSPDRIMTYLWFTALISSYVTASAICHHAPFRPGVVKGEHCAIPFLSAIVPDGFARAHKTFDLVSSSDGPALPSECLQSVKASS